MELSAKDISQQLAGNAAAVAQHILGAEGKQEGRELVFGDISGSSGKSLKICISGTKQGVWADFATGESGDLLDLWCTARHLPLKDAITEAKGYLGIKDEPRQKLHKRKEYRKPAPPKHASRPKAESKVTQYLHGRGLSDEAIAAYRIAEADRLPEYLMDGKRADWIVWPFFRDGELFAVKYQNLERNKKGKKEIVAEGKCEPGLFGWQAIPDNARSVVITEGEIDALSMWEFGCPALSVPFGGGSGAKQQWIETEFEHLVRFDTIYLCLDMDEEGGLAAKEIASRLGQHRCRFVELPKKDANECLTEGVPADYIAACMQEAATADPEELKSVAEYGEDIAEHFYPTAGERPGFNLPWNANKWRVHHGELCLWVGFNGHGKSVLLGQAITQAVQSGEKACIASFEMRPAVTFGRMFRQLSGQRVPTREVITRLSEDYADALWSFDLQGTGKIDRVLEVFEYGFRRYGIRQFVVDSLMKLGLGEDDYNGQKSAVERLKDFCNEHDVTVHLVAHSRKRETEEHAPRKMDVRGAGVITDIADNLFCVWRNKAKENACKQVADNPALKSREEVHKILERGDAQLIFDKCRENGENEGLCELAFDVDSLRYTDQCLAGNMPPPPDDGDIPGEW